MAVLTRPQFAVSLALIFSLLTVSRSLVFPVLGVHLQLSLSVAILAAGGSPLSYQDTDERTDGSNDARP